MAPMTMVVALEARRANEYRKRVRRAVRLVEKRRQGGDKLPHLIARIADMCRVSTTDVRKEMGL